MRPPEVVKTELTAQWLKLASTDLDIAKMLLPKGKQYFAFVLFHAQQCSEKALKAFLVWHDVEFPRVHDIAKLSTLCTSIEPALKSISEAAVILTKHAVQTRYPGEDSEPNTAETKQGVKKAERILQSILKRLPESLHKSEQRKKPR